MVLSFSFSSFAITSFCFILYRKGGYFMRMSTNVFKNINEKNTESGEGGS